MCCGDVYLFASVVGLAEEMLVLQLIFDELSVHFGADVGGVDIVLRHRRVSSKFRSGFWASL